MSRHTISLKTRVRYEGRAQIFDRSATIGDFDKLPDPIWHTVGHLLRSKFKTSTPKKSAPKLKS